jgi:hypothetical protein
MPHSEKDEQDALRDLRNMEVPDESELPPAFDPTQGPEQQPEQEPGAGEAAATEEAEPPPAAEPEVQQQQEPQPPPQFEFTGPTAIQEPGAGGVEAILPLVAILQEILDAVRELPDDMADRFGVDT